MAAGGAPRIVGIELLRFVAAFAVLIWHFQHFGFSAGQIDIERSGQPFYRLLFPFYEHGANGVQVFWAISGFIFFFKYLEPLSAGTVGAGDFAMARISRLYPLNLITLVAVLVLQGVFHARNGEYFVYPFNDLKHFVLNLFFMSGWGFQDGDSFNAPVWSVSAEIIVYAAFYVLIAGLSLVRAYLAAAALLVVFSIAGVGVIGTCLLYFFAGGTLALLKFHPRRLWLPAGLAARGFHLAGAGLMLAAPVVVLLALDLGSSRMTLLMNLVLTLLAIYLAVALERWFLPGIRLWKFLGNLTYASYLTHFPIQLLFMLVLPVLGLGISHRDPVLLILFISVTLGVSALTYRMVEMPAQAAIRRWHLAPALKKDTRRPVENEESGASAAMVPKG